jgi:hypothetical protein
MNKFQSLPLLPFSEAAAAATDDDAVKLAIFSFLLLHIVVDNFFLPLLSTPASFSLQII